MPAGWRYRAGGPDVQEISDAEARAEAATRRARAGGRLSEREWNRVLAAELQGFEYPEEEPYVAPKRRRLAPDPPDDRLGWDWQNDRWHSDR